MLKWPTCNTSGMAECIKMKPLGDIALYIEQNQNSLYAGCQKGI